MSAIPPEQTAWRPRTVQRNDVRLAVFEMGPNDGPTVVLVHGWPDTHHLWTHVAPLLAERFHVVAYDTRGYGDSSAPDGDAPYRLPELAADLFAVAAAVSDQPVHVVAHDWGSIQAWEAVTTPGASERIASFVSVSGPNLDHLAKWVRGNLRRPTPRRIRELLAQFVSSTYTVFFQLPVLPRAFFGAFGWAPVWRRFLRSVEGVPLADVTVSDTLHRDMISGLRYYRANLRHHLRQPDPRPTTVPVLELVNTRDIALRPAIYAGTPRYTDRHWRRDLPTGHWLPFTRPELLARWASRLIDAVGTDAQVPELRRAQVVGRPASLSGTLTVITGAGRGIGRETALLMAAHGSEIVVADIDPDSAGRTAESIVTAGGVAHPYELDVADDGAFAKFAETVAASHGVPDVVVNNAGVGLAGPLLSATDQQIRRVVDVNLVSVATGCRVFGRQMAARGEGGHIVNLASAAAFMPQQALGAYAATKAGVLLLSESLRAELSGRGIGVSAICPGIVHTGIVRATEFAGANDAQQQRLRARTDAFYRRRGYTPDRVAAMILKAVAADRAVVPVTLEAQIGYRVYRFAPRLARLVARAQVF